MYDEIANTVEHLRRQLESPAVRGLRAVGAEQRTALNAAKEELRRIGAEHLAERIAAVTAAIENDDPRGAAALLDAQTSLRLFDRILTLEVAQQALEALAAAAGSRDEREEEDEP